MGDGPLGRNSLSVFVGLGLELVIDSDPLEESLSTGGLLEMLDSDVDPLFDDSASDLLVDDDSDGPGVYVEDSSGSSVVPFVGHTLVLGTVNNDIDNISDFVASQGLGDVDGSVLLETFSEFVSSFSPVAVTVGHSQSHNIKINYY